MTRCLQILGLSLFLLLAVASFAADMVAVHVDRAPKLDGLLNDPEWQNAPITSDFVQQMKNFGAPATERTDIRVIYTDRALYIAGYCYDSQPDKITAHSLARDFSIYTEDVFAVVLDTYYDHSNSFFFCTNANGALYDAQCEQDGNSVNDRWNGVWDCRASRNDKGFFVEIEIPFSTLRFPDQAEQVWGINIERDIQRNVEVTTWQLVQPNEFIAAASRCGRLVGLKNIKRGGDIEIKPYGLAGITQEYLPYGDAKTELTKAGLNAKIPVTSRMTVDLTVNPDFAQIEDDQAVINLTRFPLFLSERREFFLESEDNFGFNFSSNSPVFYSRRIGLYQGKAIPITGGVRFIGRTEKYTIGVLDMQTAAKYGQPQTNYAVARVKRNLPNGSFYRRYRIEQRTIGSLQPGLWFRCSSSLLESGSYDSLWWWCSGSLVADERRRKQEQRRIPCVYRISQCPIGMPRYRDEEPRKITVPKWGMSFATAMHFPPA